MTTDFILAAKELDWNYDIQSTYKLIIYTGDCAYSSQESLLKEMVCQRLSMEYQVLLSLLSLLSQSYITLMSRSW